MLGPKSWWGRPKRRDAVAVPALRGFCSAETLQWLVKRERARTDRTGVGFSLLVFSSNQGNGADALERVAEILRRRLRLPDVAAWLDKGQILSLLPATPACGAWKVAEDVCSELPSDTPAPEQKVYYYPTDWLSPETAGVEHVKRPRPQERPVHAMEALFVQPLPPWKRAMDVVGALGALLLGFPVLAMAAAAVKLSSPGPVFFRQQRIGLGGRPFAIYKFRSMVADAEHQKSEVLTANEQEGPVFKIKNDPRTTSVGRFLRRTSIDELPQLWNVLRGDMSLVGPRPLPWEEVARLDVWQRRRWDVTPGLTCFWQVNGRCEIPFADWVRMDLRYVESRSLVQDLKLLLKTVPAVLSQRGAY